MSGADSVKTARLKSISFVLFKVGFPIGVPPRLSKAVEEKSVFLPLPLHASNFVFLDSVFDSFKFFGAFCVIPTF